MKQPLALVHPPGPPQTGSPLAEARLERGLTVEEAARRAGLLPAEVTWLEDGRLYRFRSTDQAIVATLLYATALRMSLREARALAGLPARHFSAPGRPLVRMAVLAALAAAAVGLLAAVAVPGLGTDRSAARAAGVLVGTRLPPAWRVAVDVLNGNGDIEYTRRFASRIGALGYRVERVTRANRFDYPQTAVYYEPGGEALAARLGHSIGVPIRPLPAGHDPRRLVVIVGPARGPGA